MASADDHPRPSGNALQSAPKAVPTAPPHSSQPRTALASSFGPYCSMPATRRFAVSLFEPLAIRLLQLTKQRRIRKDYFRASLVVFTVNEVTGGLIRLVSSSGSHLWKLHIHRKFPRS